MSAVQDISSLGARLTDPKDRETYAALISYADSLPEGDEFHRLVQLLGLHSLLTQRIPDAVSELIAELKLLPDRVTVDAAQIAAKVGETLREQVAATGFAATVGLLYDATTQIKGVSEQAVTSLQSLSQQSKSVTTTIASELARLQVASNQLKRHNTELVVKHQTAATIWRGLLLGFIGLAGLLLGIALGLNMKWLG